ncbi:MAG: M56 family metallopeptidase [Tannerellaceae bacterium]|jgi:TonB family protein|nr:M56 family metallopeptidase [Tannerellaceae bacterium]
MSPLFAYCLKVNMALVIFYVFYCMFFRKDTFFRLRRTLLLASFVMAVAYPFMHFPALIKGQSLMPETIRMYATLLGEANITAGPGASGVQRALLWQAGAVAYLAVAGILLLRLLMQSGYVLRLALRSRPALVDGVKVYVPDKPLSPFSFFGIIFISPGRHSAKEAAEILAHERAHALQCHSLDILIAGLTCVVCWINPFAWLLKREVKYNLEYLADSAVLGSGFDGRKYQYHLLSLACRHHETKTSISNNFNVLHLKNRISMMNKKRSGAIERTKYLMFFPLAAMLMLLANVEAVARITAPETVTVAALQPQTPQDSRREVFQVADEMPQFPGGEYELMKFIAESVVYPEEAQRQGIQGGVTVSYIVESDGSITSAKVERSVDPLLDAEALRVVGKFPRWTPGKNDGKAVAVRYVIPVIFRLQ